MASFNRFAVSLCRAWEWGRDKKMRKFVIVSVLALASCGPAYAPPDAPVRACPAITADEYQAAKEAGAAYATAKVRADGAVFLTTGPGVTHCATYKTGTMKPCRRPVDFVICYELADGSLAYVMVPKGETYRFNIHRGPIHCEILEGR